jgi:adenylate kinase
MRILVTGTPGVGKTVVSKELGKRLKCIVVNEMEFALQKGLGEWDSVENELEVPVKKLENELNKYLKRQDNVIVEGHLLCETKLKIDFAVLIRLHPEVLESRLENKGYRPDKIMDNVFCEGIDYCKKHLARRYSSKKIIEVQSGKNIKETALIIIKRLKEAGLS